jgi:hypothetical protein
MATIRQCQLLRHRSAVGKHDEWGGCGRKCLEVIMNMCSQILRKLEVNLSLQVKESRPGLVKEKSAVQATQRQLYILNWLYGHFTTLFQVLRQFQLQQVQYSKPSAFLTNFLCVFPVFPIRATCPFHRSLLFQQY